ncbi:MAG: ABC transporter ATP-binding protein [Chloroflexota bacterium]
MTEIAIRAEGLGRDFARVRALDDVTLSIPRGTIFGFLGPNGAGKTTTIRLLLGLLEPTAGTAEVLGFDVRRQGDQVRLRTGALLEHSGLYERLSALDNLEFYGRVWRVPTDKRRARERELLEHMGLWARRDDPVGKWSRGMKQKLAVARALLHRPELIFLDEPTAGLDPVSAAALRDDIAGLAQREGATVFLTTHNLSEAERLCGLVGVIREGKLLSLGSPDELRGRASVPRAEIVGRGFSEELLARLSERPEVAVAELRNGRLSLDLRGEQDLAPLVTFLVSNGAEVEEVHKGRASLEEAFLTMMEEEA